MKFYKILTEIPSSTKYFEIILNELYNASEHRFFLENKLFITYDIIDVKIEILKLIENLDICYI